MQLQLGRILSLIRVGTHDSQPALLRKLVARVLSSALKAAATFHLERQEGRAK